MYAYTHICVYMASPGALCFRISKVWVPRRGCRIEQGQTDNNNQEPRKQTKHTKQACLACARTASPCSAQARGRCADATRRGVGPRAAATPLRMPERTGNLRWCAWLTSRSPRSAPVAAAKDKDSLQTRILVCTLHGEAELRWAPRCSGRRSTPA